jgi:hypothetical protein
MKIGIEPSPSSGQCQRKNAVKIKAFLIILVCFYVIWGCGQPACPSKEVAEHIAKQFIFPKYSGDLYNIKLEVTRKFMKKFKNSEYCVYEFNYNATLKSYFLRYETLERQSYKKGLQVAYLHTKEGWYGTVIQRPQ